MAPLAQPLPRPRAAAASIAPGRAMLVLAAACPLASAQLFELPRYVTAAEGGEFRALGDFDADGDLDLLHFTGFSDWSDLSVFFNDGSGTFSPGPKSVFAAGPYLEVAKRPPALGDFDGNGFLDVAIGHTMLSGGEGSGVEVLFGDGSGSFLSHFVAMGRGPRAQLAGQTDVDRHDELFVHVVDADYQQTFSWLDWRGDHFVLSPGLPIGGAGDPAGAVWLVAGDFDGDRDTDIAGASSDHTKVRLFPTVHGASTLGPEWTVIPQMVNVNHRLAAGDLDGDGDDDLLHIKSVHPDDPGPWIGVFENSGTGLVAHTPLRVAPLAEGPFGVTDKLGDWNGDGWLDLFANGSDCKRLRSDGNWGWVDGFEIHNTGWQHMGAGVGDVTGDGLPDYVAPQAIASGDGTFPDAPLLELTGGFGVSTFGDRIHFLDREGDGDVDIVGTNARQNDGTGTFTPLPGLGFFGSPFEPLPGTINSIVAFDDFDGDGRRDYIVGLFQQVGIPPYIVLEFDSMRLMVDDGLGHYVDAGLAFPDGIELVEPPYPDNGHWDTGDADGDGDIDILVNNVSWRNDGTGHFPTLVGGWSGRGRGVLDLGNDGDIDVIVSRDLGTNVQILLYERNGPSFTPHALGIQANDQAEPELADLDGDGDLDLWSGHPDLEGVLVWENVGTALEQRPDLDARGVRLHEPALEDVDGDGVDELLLSRAGTSGEVVSVQRRIGPGLTFEIVEEYQVFWEVESFIDGDGDGDLDIFGSHRFENIRVPEPEGGVVRQFGAGFPGSGGVVPILGAAGPVTSDNPAAELRLVRGVGGGVAYIVHGLAETQVPDAPLPGMTLYVDAPMLAGPFMLDGPPAVANAGTLTLPMPHEPLLFGIELVLQAWILDGGSSTGASASGGLALTFGL